MNLVIEVSRSGPATVMALSGELDIAEVPTLDRALRRAEADRPATLVVDLRGLQFLDSPGLRLLLEADARARSDDRRLMVVRGPRPVQRVFDIAMLEERLTLVDDVPGSDGEPDV